MGLNDTPRGERLHIAIFGKRNAGKSSIINAITSQNLAIVSDVKGTTTDPVYKAMELLPLGPVMMIDTPGLDDNGELGAKRIEKTIQVLQKTNIAIIIVDIMVGFSDFEKDLLKDIKLRKLSCIIVLNKIDLYQGNVKVMEEIITKESGCKVVGVSAPSKVGIHELKEELAKLIPEDEIEYPIVKDLLDSQDLVVLVVPIDSAAPKGRLILPQQQTIRDILEAGAIAIVTRETELKSALENLTRKPKLVITDSQAFAKVSKETPQDTMLTSFSILFARHKGNLEEQIKGAKAVELLKDEDTILVAEGCTHHRQCDDIGTVKIPKWLLEYTGKKINFEYCSGTEYPKDLTKFALVVHCGGCTLNKKEMEFRIKSAKQQKIPIVNYGILIAYMNGILKRSIEPFKDISNLLV